MSNLLVGPLPAEFYRAFLDVMEPQASGLIDVWFAPKDCGKGKTPFTELMLRLLEQVATRLGLRSYDEYFGLDKIFYRELDADNFRRGETWAKFISVAIEHENDCASAATVGSTKEEMNKLQLFNAPLKVLITYASPEFFESLLKRYAGIVKGADVFGDFSTSRRQLVVFGWKQAEQVKWEGYEYSEGAFHSCPSVTASAPTGS